MWNFEPKKRNGKFIQLTVETGQDLFKHISCPFFLNDDFTYFVYSISYNSGCLPSEYWLTDILD